MEQGLEQVRQAVRSTLQRLKSPSNQAAPGNWMMEALVSPEARHIEAQVHSRCISVGKTAEDLARSLVRAHPQLELTTELRGIGVNSRDALPTTRKTPDQDPRVWTRLPPQAVEREADWVKTTFLASRERDPDTFSARELDRLIGLARKRLARETLIPGEPHPRYFDLGYRRPGGSLSLLEMKSSGKLDSKNAPDELRHILLAVLSADPRRGGVTPGASQTFDPGKASPLERVFPRGRLWVGEKFWLPLLPPGVGYKQLIQLFGQQAQDLGVRLSF